MCPDVDGFQQFPLICATAAEAFSAPGEQPREIVDKGLSELASLQKLLLGQTAETIDDFIVDNPMHSAVARRAVGAVLYGCCTRVMSGGRVAAPFDARSLEQPPAVGAKQAPPSERNWIHLLINIVRQGIRRQEVWAENKIQIVTFNYDCILEHVLDKQFDNTETTRGDWRNYIEIVHMHGACGKLDEGHSTPAITAAKWGDAISVVQDNEAALPDAVKQARARAVQMIDVAKHVYAMGFAFAGPNCRQLKFRGGEQMPRTRQVTLCNYNGAAGVALCAARYAQSDAKRLSVISGTPDRPLSIPDFIRAGHLGELPG